jgi:hypothetical protein
MASLTKRKPDPAVAKIERAARRLDVVEFIDVAQPIGVDASKITKKLLTEPAASRR